MAEITGENAALARPSTDWPPAGSASSARPSDAGLYKWYVLLILFLIFICSYIDRSIMSILQVPIQRELGLSDFQLGLLNGLAFTLCYALVAIPIARLADRGSRKMLIAIILAVWSVSTMLCGWATSFATLFACRVVVAVGESGCAPMSVALIFDYFARGRRAMAVAIWTLSVPLGSMLGYGAGGWLNSAVGWRSSFVYVGALGIVLLPIWLLTVREPSRGGLDGRVPQQQRRLREALAFLWNIRTLRFQIVGASMQLGILYVFLTWNVPFFVRSHHLPIGEAALYMSLAVGLGGAVGSFGAGAITDRLSALDPKWFVLLPAIATAAILPIGAAQLFAGDLRTALGCAFVANMLCQTYLAPNFALAQSLVPAEMRAFASSVQALVMLVLAGAPCPIVVGWLSDRATPHLGPESLRFAMAAMLALVPIGVGFYLLAGRTLREDWARAFHENVSIAGA